MNDLCFEFFKNGKSVEIVECVKAFLITCIEIKSLENNLETFYTIDHINNTIYNNNEISNLCFTIKQNQLIKFLISNNNIDNNKEINLDFFKSKKYVRNIN